MDDLVQIFKNWPVLIQGAVGSALFWLVLKLIKKGYEIVEQSLSHRSLRQRKSWLISNIARLKALSSKEHTSRSYYASMLIYRSLRHLFNGIIWLSFGLIVNTLFNPMGIIGFVGCIYFMLKAFETVKPINSENLDKETELSSFQDELKLVRERLKEGK